MSATAIAAPGALDRDFGTDGRATIRLGGPSNGVDAAVDPRGRALLAGREAFGNGGSAVVRLARDGGLDRSFSGDGRAVVDFSARSDARVFSSVEALASARGGVLVAGRIGPKRAGDEFDFQIGVEKLTGAGRPDPRFAAAGRLELDTGPGGDTATDVAVDEQGRILLAGRTGEGTPEGPRFALVRLLADGTPDPDFGVRGVADPATLPEGNAVAVEPDAAGGVIVLGTSPGDGSDLLATRFMQNGTLDAGFGSGGRTRISFPGGGSEDIAADLAIAGDGDLLVVGSRVLKAGSAPRHGDAIVARLLADGTPDSGFAAGGARRLDLRGGRDMATAVMPYRDGLVLAAATTSERSRGVATSLAALDPAGELDERFGRGGVATFKARGDRRGQLTPRALVSSRSRIIVAGTLSRGDDETAISAIAVSGR
ncbi:hypothetical protein HJD18_00550 [Thermoleophilia bacterium SCSIO 60948]|nr:hypothetical protein HJD18_00550 [Thermoleophilia bacterium SCSIO 60948]